MIKVIDEAALKLIAPIVSYWGIHSISLHPQSMHYIDLTLLSGWEWTRLLIRTIDVQRVEELCTEYNGGSKLSGREWEWLLEGKAWLEKYRK